MSTLITGSGVLSRQRGAKFEKRKDYETKTKSSEIKPAVIETSGGQEKTAISTTHDVPLPSAVSILMSEIRREWASLSEFFKDGNEKQQDELRGVVNQLIKFANRWQASLQALVSQAELDNTSGGILAAYCAKSSRSENG